MKKRTAGQTRNARQALIFGDPIDANAPLALADIAALLGKLLLVVNRQQMQITRLKRRVADLEAANEARRGEL